MKLKDMVKNSMNHTNTRFYNSQPMSVAYSQTKAKHTVRGLTAMQDAFMKAMGV